jgi:hypothetical protein
MRALIITRNAAPAAYEWWREAVPAGEHIAYLCDTLVNALRQFTLQSRNQIPHAIPEVLWPGVPFPHIPADADAYSRIRTQFLKRVPKRYVEDLSEAIATAALLEEQPCHAWVGWRSAATR